jgi:hypothetical protein
MTRMVSIRFTRAELEAVIQAAAIARVEGFTLAADLDAALERARAKRPHPRGESRRARPTQTHPKRTQNRTQGPHDAVTR